MAYRSNIGASWRMATQRTANVFITNETDGTAQVTLLHQNDTNGTQSATWTAQPGQTVGPLVVHFETGFGSWGVLDWWSVTMTVQNGSTPGIYQNTGTSAFPHWKECQLQTGDVDKNIVCTVSVGGFGVNLPSGGCTDGMSRLSNYSPIRNVFVLMLENRSFDHIFGHSGLPVAGPPPGTTNSYNNISYAVGSPAPTTMTADPGHEFNDVVEQLAGAGATYPPGGPYPPIVMSGFVSNYATTTDEDTTPPTPPHYGDIMLGFDTPTQLPTSYALAQAFAVCDQWFCSIPGPTWPNRMFIHAASSAGLDHTPTTAEIIKWETVAGFTFPHGSIYDALTKAGLSWRLYNDNTDAYSDDPQNGSAFGAIAQVSSLKGVTMMEVQSLTRFASDLQGPYPYQYTFIEPNYGDVTGNTYAGGSSQHPMDDVYGGEGIIQAVYQAIRNSPLWNTSLLVITYDEHGGFYDHVKPPPAAPPADGSGSQLNDSGFTFDLLGIRVPALVVSPLIPAGTVSSTVFDHSSVPATLERLFGFPALTARDAAAADLRGLLTLTTPRTDCPTTLPGPVARQVRSVDAEAQEADDALPVPDSGNLPAFLAIARKAAYESYAQTPEERALVDEQYAAIRTRGDARNFLASVTARLNRMREAGATTG